MTIARINESVDFVAFDLPLLASTEKNLQDLQVKMRVIEEQEPDFRGAKDAVPQVMQAMYRSRDSIREFGQALKLNAAANSKAFNDYLQKMNASEKARVAYLEMLEERFDRGLRDTRSQVAALNKTAAALSVIVMGAELKASQSEVERACQDDTGYSTHQVAYEKLVGDLQALERTIAEIKPAFTDENRESGQPATALQLSNQVLAALTAFYGPVSKMFELVDVQKVADALRAQIKVKEREKQLLDAAAQSLARQRSYFDLAEQFDQSRGVYEMEIGKVLSGIHGFLKAHEAPEADWRIRVANYKANTDSLNGYLAPLVNG